MARFSLGLWIGLMTFMGGILAPRVFRVLERQDASTLQNALFPVYYEWGMVCCVLAFLGIVVARRKLAAQSFGGLRFFIPAGIALALILAAAFARYHLVPAIQVAQQLNTLDSLGAVVQHPDFARLHTLSVRINVASLVAAVALWFWI